MRFPPRWRGNLGRCDLCTAHGPRIPIIGLYHRPLEAPLVCRVCFALELELDSLERQLELPLALPGSDA